MNNSSEAKKQETISRETAMGFLAANMAVPGTGTFLAGRRLMGCVQLVAALGGMGVSVVLGTKMIVWMLANWTRLQDPYGDPVESMREVWLAIRWPLAGIASFGVAWIWAVLQSWMLIRKTGSAKQKQTHVLEQ